KFPLGIVALLTLGTCISQTVSPSPTPAQWKEDLEFLKAGLAREQKDFAKLYPKLNAGVESLEAEVEELPDYEVVSRIMRLIAAPNVSHNYVHSPAFGFPPRLPLTLQWFPDGLAVTAASQEYLNAIGARVVRIGSMSPDALLAGAAPYLPHENDSWLR